MASSSTIEREPVLRDLGEAGAEVALVERRERVHVGEHRAGWANVPTRFLPSGRFTAVFPPTAASTWAVSVVGTCTNGSPRMYVDATKPARSPVGAAAERDHDVVAVGLLGRELVQQGLVHLQGLRLLARGDRRAARTRAPRDASPSASDPNHRSATVRSATTNARSASGTPAGARGFAEHAGADRHVVGAPGDRARSHGPTQLLDDRVGDLARRAAAVDDVGRELPVEGPPLGEQALEIALLADQGTVLGRTDPLAELLERHVEVDHGARVAAA